MSEFGSPETPQFAPPVGEAVLGQPGVQDAGFAAETSANTTPVGESLKSAATLDVSVGGVHVEGGVDRLHTDGRVQTVGRLAIGYGLKGGGTAHVGLTTHRERVPESVS